MISKFCFLLAGYCRPIVKTFAWPSQISLQPATAATRFGGELAIYGMIALAQGSAARFHDRCDRACDWYRTPSPAGNGVDGNGLLRTNPRASFERAKDRKSHRLVGRAGTHIKPIRSSAFSSCLRRMHKGFNYYFRQSERIRGWNVPLYY